MSEQHKQLHALRVRVDGIVNNIGAYPATRETALAKTHAQFGFMWMGKYLGTLGAENPYPKSTDPNAKAADIEPATDKTTANAPDITLYNDDERTSFLTTQRKNLEEVIEILDEAPEINRKAERARNQAIIHLQEAKMSIGLELGAIRDAIKAQNADNA